MDTMRSGRPRALGFGALVLAAGLAAPCVAEDPVQAVLRDDFYVAGSRLVVSRDVAGDLVAAGGSVAVTGRVAEDALVAGGTVDIAGDVGDVLRVAGGRVTVRGNVGGYVVMGGGEVELERTSSVSGGLFVNAGRATVSGTVLGPLEVKGGDVRIDGTVAGEVTVHAGTLALGDRAVLMKGIRYGSRREMARAPGARVLGPTTRLPAMDAGAGAPAGIVLVMPAAIRFAGLLLTGVALVLLFPRAAGSFVAEAMGHFRRDLAVGAGVLLLGPPAAVLLAATLVGLPLGVLGSMAYVAMLVLAVVGSGLVVGTIARRRLTHDERAGVDWKTAVMGLALLPALAWVPYVGWLLFAVVVAGSLGSLSVLGYRSIGAARIAPSAPV